MPFAGHGVAGLGVEEKSTLHLVKPIDEIPRIPHEVVDTKRADEMIAEAVHHQQQTGILDDVVLQKEKLFQPDAQIPPHGQRPHHHGEFVNQNAPDAHEGRLGGRAGERLQRYGQSIGVPLSIPYMYNTGNSGTVDATIPAAPRTVRSRSNSGNLRCPRPTVAAPRAFR